MSGPGEPIDPELIAPAEEINTGSSHVALLTAL
jgi:hypothetical protein